MTFGMLVLNQDMLATVSLLVTTGGFTFLYLKYRSFFRSFFHTFPNTPVPIGFAGAKYFYMLNDYSWKDSSKIALLLIPAVALTTFLVFQFVGKLGVF